MAPSPTGYLHLGHAKAYLVNYALAKSVDGEFILRIEDTDTKRNKMETVDSLIEDCSWLGISYDKGPKKGEKNEYFQSERFAIYKKYVDELLEKGLAYKAYETPEERAAQIEAQRKKGGTAVYSGAHRDLTPEQQAAYEVEGRKPVVRLKVPQNEIISFHDGIYGDVKVNTNTIGDIVIQKSDGTPMYNFCVVIDDHLMGVTDVIRGFGHLSNTPKQIAIYKIFGWEIPHFAHFSDLLNEDGQGKLSKRKGAKAISRYRAVGYLADAIFNYIMVISCSFTFAGKDEEVMTRDEIYKRLTVDKVLKTNARFDPKKLDWFNGQHIRKISPQEFESVVINWLQNDAKGLKEFEQTFDESIVDEFLRNQEILKKALPLVQERINSLSDIIPSLRFMIEPPKPENIDISPARHEAQEFDSIAKKLYNTVQNLGTPWSQEEWESAIRGLGDESGWKHGDVFMALRLMIVGDRFSPPLFEAMNILGRDVCTKRIGDYIQSKSN
jgi:nondiscriminating glutamyl-tRNA synthetase